MGVGLPPLEFTECLTDSPQFRENLQNHEKELERTSQQIKRLIREVKEIVQAAKRLSAAQLALATSMEQIEFACIGASMTDDELIISRSLTHFAAHIRTVEDERERMLGNAHEQIILPLERFRKEHIGTVKEGKKKFDKKTGKFCQTQERTLALSAKKVEAERLREADAAMDMAERDFCQASLEYVFLLQAVHERKKFELVETLLGFVFGWWTFHHQAHEVHRDAEPLVRDLQLRIQRTRNNFEETSKQTESLMKKMMEMRQMSKESPWWSEEGGVRAGHVLLLERKAFGSAWVRHYCAYAAGTMRLTPYAGAAPAQVMRVRAARPVPDAERRFCWEALPSDRERAPAVLQSPSERERAAWLRAVCGDSPPEPALAPRPPSGIDSNGMAFVTRALQLVEERGLREQGLYRVAGVASKVARCVRAAAEPALLGELASAETKTLTSALKAYLRALPDPLLTSAMHDSWLAAARLEPHARASRVAALLPALPPPNRRLLRVLLAHLRRVAAQAPHNLMPPTNLAVCFGPTLLRPPKETVASILNLKFYNVIVETLLLLPPELQDLPDPPDALHEEVPPARPPSPPPAEHLAYYEPTDLHDQGVPFDPHDQGVPYDPHDQGVPYDPHEQGVPFDPHELNNGSVVVPPAAACLPSRTDHARGEARYSYQHQALLRQLSPSPPAGPGPGAGTRVRTLYACLGEAAGELSFEPNQIITDVLPSGERGWLRGTLNGRAGLVPENYVQPLP